MVAPDDQEAYEDCARHREDAKLQQVATVVVGKERRAVMWRDIKVGQLVEIHQDVEHSQPI